MPPAKEQESIRLLQWVQQQAGVSRRKAQELIASGEVTVNGELVRDPFIQVSVSAVRSVALRGHPLATELPEQRIYRYHKPAGVLCSHDDPFSGNTVGRILRAEGFIGYTWAGRLDRDAEGLLVVTNDGDVVQAFTHPRYEMEKTYQIWLKKMPERRIVASHFAAMKRGIQDAGETLRIIEGRVEGRPPHAHITLAEGRKHEIKRLFVHFGLEVIRLKRISMGPIGLGRLAPGTLSRLSPDEEQRAIASARSRLDAG